jgi:sulfite reductase (ferredoxin)
MSQHDDQTAAASSQAPFNPGTQHGLIVRCNIPAGHLTAEQYLVLDDLATRYANETLRITTRHNVQLHGVLAKDLQDTLRHINASLSASLGASGEVGRHLMRCPAPGADAVSTAIQAVTQQLVEHLLPQTRAYHEVWLDGEKVYDGQVQATGEPSSGRDARLPQHFKIGVAAPGDNCIDVYTHDLGLVPVALDGVWVGCNVLIGGGMGMTPGKPETFPRLAAPLAFIAPQQVLAVLEQILALRREHAERMKRPQVRFKSIIGACGVEPFRATLEQRLGTPLQDAVPMPSQHLDLHLGWHPQGDGRWYLGLSIENGRIRDVDGMHLRTALRELIATFRPGVRLTPNQDLLLTDLPQAQRGEVERLLHDHGIPLADQLSQARRYAMACPALPTCGHAVAEAERALPEIVGVLETAMTRLGLQDEQLTIRMTGCSFGCTRPYVADLAFVGVAPNRYDVYVGGRLDGSRLNLPFKDLVAGEALVDTVLPLLAGYKYRRTAGEGFGDFCTRLGINALRDLTDGFRGEQIHG